jgi:hypothetical protein
VLSPAREVPKAQGDLRRSPRSTIVSDSQDVAGVAHAYLKCGYTQQEIADHLGVHYSTVSRRVDAVDGRRRRNTKREDGT